MKALTIIAAAAVAASAVAANETPEEILGGAVRAIQSEGWTAEETANGIRALLGMYARDNRTVEGRKKWHGKIVSQVVTDGTNGLTRTTTYEDGAAFADSAAPVRRATPAPADALTVARLRAARASRNLSQQIAAAMERAAVNAATTNEVTVTIGN